MLRVLVEELIKAAIFKFLTRHILVHIHKYLLYILQNVQAI